MMLLPVRLFSRDLVARLLVFTALASGCTVFGQSGSIQGRVLNVASGDYLNNARVTIPGTRLEAATDQNGEFQLGNVPAGIVAVSVSYTGLPSQTKSVEVAAGRIARADFDLVLAGSRAEADRIVTLDAFTVEEREFTAQSAALNEQRTAGNIKNVVSIEEFGDLGITNPGHFLTYVPGVSNVYNTTGEVEGIGLRGMPSSGTVVMFDGVQAATHDPNSRSYNFGGTPTSMLDRIEVTKVPTPDLPANAVGGSINMVTKSGFNHRAPRFTYNLFATAQANGSHGNFPAPGKKLAGNDPKTTALGMQPGFDLNYSRPVGSSLALTLSAGHNARYQDREYLSPTWDRVRFVQTASTFNSVLNLFYQNTGAIGLDWKKADSVFRVRVDYTQYDAITRQNQFQFNTGAGSTGGPTSTQGAATGVGTVTQSSGQNLNQYRRLFNARLGQTYTGAVWKFDWNAAYSGATRENRDVDDGMFSNASANLTNLVVSLNGLDQMSSMRLQELTIRSRTGVLLDPYDVRGFTLNTTSGAQLKMQNSVETAGANVSRAFFGGLPITLKSGVLLEKTRRDTRSGGSTWNFRPPASAGGQTVGNYDILSEGYSDRREFNGGVKIKWLSTAKLYTLYQQHPDYFQFNEVTSYTNRVNNSKELEETISAAYLRADAKAFDNRLWVVAGVRFEHTADEGHGPLNDIRATYARNAAGQIVTGSNGRPVQVAGDALALAKLRFTERGAASERTYQDYYPSLNASYTVGPNLVMRSAYARTIGRPDLGSIIPGTSISDPSVAAPTITVINTGLRPWTANNYDVTLEAYELKGATLSLSGFRKEINGFFNSVRLHPTQALLDQYGLPDDLLTGNYEILSTENSSENVAINGLEWSWRQSLRPFATLPAWTRGIGWFVNGTHLRIGGPGVDNFSGYSTRIINWGVSFARGNFAVKANATYSNGPRNAVVAASATTPAGTYSGLAPRMLVGGSLEYRLNKRFTLHASGQNLTNALYRNMTYAPGAPDYTRPTQYRDNGIAYLAGIKGEF